MPRRTIIHRPLSDRTVTNTFITLNSPGGVIMKTPIALLLSVVSFCLVSDIGVASPAQFPHRAPAFQWTSASDGNNAINGIPFPLDAAADPSPDRDPFWYSLLGDFRAIRQVVEAVMMTPHLLSSLGQANLPGISMSTSLDGRDGALVSNLSVDDSAASAGPGCPLRRHPEIPASFILGYHYGTVNFSELNRSLSAAGFGNFGKGWTWGSIAVQLPGIFGIVKMDSSSMIPWYFQTGLQVDGLGSNNEVTSADGGSVIQLSSWSLLGNLCFYLPAFPALEFVVGAGGNTTTLTVGKKVLFDDALRTAPPTAELVHDYVIIRPSVKLNLHALNIWEHVDTENIPKIFYALILEAGYTFGFGIDDWRQGSNLPMIGGPKDDISGWYLGGEFRLTL
jgi:hypothetical protein